METLAVHFDCWVIVMCLLKWNPDGDSGTTIPLGRAMLADALHSAFQGWISTIQTEGYRACFLAI